MAGKEASGTGKHEVCAQRRHHHWYRRRRQRGNPRGSRRRELLPVWVDGGTGPELKLRGYRPQEVAEKNASLREVLNFIGSGALAGGDQNLFRPLLDRLLHEGPFLVLADYQAYADCQEQVTALWCDQPGMDTQSNPQRGAYGQVLTRPLHP